MCWYVYIATSKPILNPVFRENPQKGPPPLLHFSEIEENLERRDNMVRPLFKAPFLYYVGSSSGCSCNLSWLSFYEDETGKKEYEWHDSAPVFLEFIQQYTRVEPLEMYAVWEDAWDEGNAAEPLSYVEINPEGLTPDTYFGLESRQFYRFWQPLK
jgi:hypothetical protein